MEALMDPRTTETLPTNRLRRRAPGPVGELQLEGAVSATPAAGDHQVPMEDKGAGGGL